MMRIIVLSLVCTGLAFSHVYFSVSGAKAQVRQSGSYQIQSDSINFAGGLSSSTNYVQESTAGEVATGESASGNFNLYAGYQQMQQVYIALTGAADVTLTPAIGGLTGGVATGSQAFSVVTDSSAGYQLTIAATSSPAMQNPLDSIDDYAPAGAVPDFSFNFGANEAYFGFSPEGPDVAQRFLDNGTDTCGIGASETSDRCWDGLSTTAVVVATAANANHPAGATTTVRFQVGVGGATAKTAGVYRATTTITALPL